MVAGGLPGGHAARDRQPGRSRSPHGTLDQGLPALHAALALPRHGGPSSRAHRHRREGDFLGRGVWTFTARDGQTEVAFDWRLRANKPLLRALSFLLKPVFSANHRWAMARGEESLRLELLRRRAPTEAERARVPLPPGPTLPHNLRR